MPPALPQLALRNAAITFGGKPLFSGIDVTLAVGTIRGVESRGMMCSEKELQISDDHNGIIDLPADAPVGTSYAAYAGLDDPVVEINLTPNRPDCTSIHGIARDLAAAGLGTLKPQAKPAFRTEGETPVGLRIILDDERLCPGFGLRLVRGVRNGPSPAWMPRRVPPARLCPTIHAVPGPGSSTSTSAAAA